MAPTIAMIPSLLLAFLAIGFAIRARQPSPVDLPPSVKDAFDYASSYGSEENAKAGFLGRLHAACASLEIAIDIKADRVKVATWAFFGSIVALLVPLAVAVKAAL